MDQSYETSNDSSKSLRLPEAHLNPKFARFMDNTDARGPRSKGYGG